MQTFCDLTEFKILYHDEHIVAIHKPAGLLVHRSPIDKHETQFAVQMTRDAIGQEVFPIHRLDKPTSGLLLFSLDKTSARDLGEQFMNHTIAKTYHAICRGWAAEQGLIDKPLKYQKDKIADKDKADTDVIQEAQTAYKTLATTSVNHQIGRFEQQRYCLMELAPKTGRKHQLRRHLNHLNHPIIGDVKYGDRHHNHFFNDWHGHHRLYLAATSLEFIHPATKKNIKINAPIQSNFESTLKALGMLEALPTELRKD